MLKQHGIYRIIFPTIIQGNFSIIYDGKSAFKQNNFFFCLDNQNAGALNRHVGIEANQMLHHFNLDKQIRL